MPDYQLTIKVLIGADDDDEAERVGDVIAQAIVDHHPALPVDDAYCDSIHGR